jgi:serine/threonine protein kinase
MDLSEDAAYLEDGGADVIVGEESKDVSEQPSTPTPSFSSSTGAVTASAASEVKAKIRFSNDLKDYRVIKKLGEGVFGRVVQVEYQEQVYALKIQDIVPDAQVGFPHLGTGLIEADILMRLHHPNLIRCHHVFWQLPTKLFPATTTTKAAKGAGRAGVVQETKHIEVLGKGNTISLVLVLESAASSLEEDDAEKFDVADLDDDVRILQLFRDVLCGLSFLHAHDFIHGDLKPGNILGVLTDTDLKSGSHSDRVWKLADFGLVQRDVPQDRNVQIQSAFYRAPETILKSNVTVAADIWSVGVMFLDMIRTRGSPFAFDDASSVLQAQIKFLGFPSVRWRRLHHVEIPATVEELENVPQVGVEKNLIPDSSSLWYFKDSPREFKLAVGFLNRMLAMDPDKRATALELLHDPIFSLLGPLPSQQVLAGMVDTKQQSVSTTLTASAVSATSLTSCATGRYIGGATSTSASFTARTPIMNLLDYDTARNVIDLAHSGGDASLSSYSTVLCLDLFERYTQVRREHGDLGKMSPEDFLSLARACAYLAWILNEATEPLDVADGGTYGLGLEELLRWLLEITTRLHFQLYWDNVATVCKKDGEKTLQLLLKARALESDPHSSFMGSTASAKGRSVDVWMIRQLKTAFQKRQFGSVCRYIK